MSVARVIKFVKDDIKFIKAGRKTAKANRDDGGATSLDKKMWQAWMKYYDQLLPVDEKILSTLQAGGSANRKKVRRWLKRENEALNIVIVEITKEINKPNQLPGTIRHLKSLRKLMMIEYSSNTDMRDETPS